VKSLGVAWSKHWRWNRTDQDSFVWFLESGGQSLAWTAYALLVSGDGIMVDPSEG
jgi:hypothetical protein